MAKIVGDLTEMRLTNTITAGGLTPPAKLVVPGLAGSRTGAMPAGPPAL